MVLGRIGAIYSKWGRKIQILCFSLEACFVGLSGFTAFDEVNVVG